MSEVAEKLDAKGTLATWCRQVAKMYGQDLAAIPEDSYTQSPGGKARTVSDFTSEVVGFNRLVAEILRGGAPAMRSEEEREAFKRSFTTTSFCQEQVSASADELADAIEQCPDERLASVVTAPWGDSMPALTLATIAVNHILYHDGQLNYIQSLNGDGEMHWFD